MAKPKYYESDTTRFLRDLLEKNPQITEERRKGRDLWWDKKLDLELLRRKDESSVPQEAYVYQTKT
jgi:hypothetical protein